MEKQSWIDVIVTLTIGYQYCEAWLLRCVLLQIF